MTLSLMTFIIMTVLPKDTLSSVLWRPATPAIWGFLISTMTLGIMTFIIMTLLPKGTLSSVLWYPSDPSCMGLQMKHHNTQQNDTLTKRYPEFSVVVPSNPRYMGVSNKALQLSLYEVGLSFGNPACF